MKGDQAQPETIGIVKGLQFSFKICSVQSRCILLVLPDFSCENIYTFPLARTSSVHLLRPAWDNTGKYIYLVFLPCPFRAIAENFIMNFVFISVVVALTGLFGLAFALFGILTIKKQRGGRAGKQQPRQPSRGSSSGPQKTFHRCTTPGCKIKSPGAGLTWPMFHLSDTRSRYE